MTGEHTPGPVLLRVEKGLPDEHELAALVAIFGVGQAGAVAAEPAGGARLPAPWREPDQAARSDEPRTWQDAAAEPGGQVTRQHFAVYRPISLPPKGQRNDRSDRLRRHRPVV